MKLNVTVSIIQFVIWAAGIVLFAWIDFRLGVAAALISVKFTWE